MAKPKGKFDRIQMRFSPEKNLLDAFCVSILANCALSPSALFKALLLRYGMEDMGGVGLNPDAQAYIASIHPKAANKDAAGHMPVGEIASEMEAGEQVLKPRPAPKKKPEPKKSRIIEIVRAWQYLPRRNW